VLSLFNPSPVDWRKIMWKSRPAVIVYVSALALLTASGGAAQQPRPEQPPVKQHTFDLDTSYITLPLPPSEQAYAPIEGARLKQYVNEITAVSRKSRDDGEKYWGRIAGTKYDDMIEGWVEQKFKAFGLQNVHRQYFDLPPQFFPTDWSVTATGNGKTLTFSTVRPAGRTVTTPAGGLDLEVVWVGLGTEADFAGRDVKGKLVMIHSVPTPAVISHSATWSGAAERAVKKGASAVLINLAIVGTNWQTHLNSGAPGVPTLSIGSQDADALRGLLEQGPVKAKVVLSGETRTGLRDANVWGTLPGATDEEILVFAHHDAYFEGAIDNASGMAVMVGLAEYFSKIPQSQRRRTMKFVTTSGHHAGSQGVQWMHDTRETFFAKTALALNVEHVSATQTYVRGPVVRKSNNIAARRWWVFGSDKLASLALNAFRTFGVTVYHDMETQCCGDSSAIQRDVPNVVLMESPVYYHTDQDTADIVPDAGLAAVGRAYAKLIDEVNKVSRRELLPEAAATTSPQP
jgi:hypothetical protein